MSKNKNRILIVFVLILVSFLIFLLTFQLNLPTRLFQIKGKSMLPTLSDKTLLLTYPAKTLFKTYIPQRGDIVIATNAKTTHDGTKADFVKRVVGIGGDVLKIDNGNVYLNGKLLDEPYVLNNNSTWVLNKICGEYNIPKDHVFLMGDNRLYSSDSRDIGLFSNKEIISYLPLSKQDKYKIIWATNNQKLTDLDINEFIKLINVKRSKVGSQGLIANPILTNVASRRSNTILEYNDESYSATKSGNTVKKILAQLNFNKYGVINEYYILDNRLSANRLVDFIMGREDLKKLFLDKSLNEIGIAKNKGNLDGCGADITDFVFFGAN